MKPILVKKRPVVVEAMRWLGLVLPAGGIDGETAWLPPEGGASVADLQLWGVRVEPTGEWGRDQSLLVHVAPEDSWVRCPVGFWIIRGVAGEFYPCDPDVFARTYEREP